MKQTPRQTKFARPTAAAPATDPSVGHRSFVGSLLSGSLALVIAIGCGGSDGTVSGSESVPEITMPSAAAPGTTSAPVSGASEEPPPVTTTEVTRQPSTMLVPMSMEPASAPTDQAPAPVEPAPGLEAPTDPPPAEPSPTAIAPGENPEATQETPEPEGFPDVPDPVFEGPWFPCPARDYPEHTVVVKTHEDAVHTYSSATIDSEVELPDGSFKAVALRVEHECPSGGICDLYDRRAVVELVNPSDPEGPTIALMRYVTTYRFVEGRVNHMCTWTDVTDYASLLTGTQTIRSWLDTVVSPGDELGDGWQVSAELVFYPGPSPDQMHVQELYGRFVNIGEGPGSIDEQTPATTVDIPSDVTRVEALLTVSGHGWGPENTDNCAEFCRLDQTISVNGGTPHVINPFRDDCASNPLASLQQRDPTGSRNGWCPGAVVLPHKIDITDEVTPGMPAEIDFGVQRPDGGEYIDADPTGYNPNEYVSLQLLMSTSAAD